MAKVLVTGAGGKIGRALMPDLVARGHQAIGLYRSRIGDAAGVTWHPADIARPDTYAGALEGCDAVIHLAVDFRPEMMDAINFRATVDLLQAARIAGIRYFGFASSIVVYGSPPRREVSEATPVIDLGKPLVGQYLANDVMLGYARTKVAAEQALAADAAGLTIDLYRPTVVSTLDGLLEAGEWGIGRKARSAHRTTQYVTTIDVAAAICHLMERGLSTPPRGAAEAFNLADDAAGTYAQLLDTAFRATGAARFRLPLRLPAWIDRVKDIGKFRTVARRTALGKLRVSTAKLRGTGFVPPLGLDRALDRALAEFVRDGA